MGKMIYDKQLLLDQVLPVIRKAGSHLISRTAGRFEQQAKSGTANFVTETDITVQQQIFSQLKEITPSFELFGEETSTQNCDFTKPVWILDPVDGTTNLMFQYRHSAISLALFDHGSIELAMTYNPYLEEMFTAIRGQGMLLNGQHVSCRQTEKLSQALVGFGTTPYDRDSSRKTFSIVERLFAEVMDIRRSGSAVLDLAYVACGRLSAFFECSLQPWDYAAGLLFVQEAGGQLTRLDGSPVSIRTSDSILASNSQLHPDLLAAVRAVDQTGTV